MSVLARAGESTGFPEGAIVKTNNHRVILLLLAAVLVCAVASSARAEDVEKKFRFGLALGGSNTPDKAQSDAGNFLRLENADGSLFAQYEDPRNDEASIGTLGIEPAYRMTASAQYGVTKLFVLEGSVGYQMSDVGKVEVQAQFDGEPIEANVQRFKFRIFRLGAGSLTQIPLKLTAIARFRPKATMNPYVGFGVGYTFVGFAPSGELNDLSRNLDGTEGQFTVLQEFPGTFNSPNDLIEPLSGATIEAPNFVEWNVVGGAEWSLRKKWSVFVDLRYNWATKQLNLRFNDLESLGVSVPDGTQDAGSVYALTKYGGYYVPSGLIDDGCLVPADVLTQLDVACGAAICALNPGSCVFRSAGEPYEVPLDPQNPSGQTVSLTLPESDGVPDGGIYYVKGAEIKYGGPLLQVGFRYMF